MPRFSWDVEKASKNMRKHGITFEDAIAVFADENARLLADPDHSQSEDRFLLLGFSASARLLVVCHTYREDDGEIRIISARKATRREEIQYGGFL